MRLLEKEKRIFEKHIRNFVTKHRPNLEDKIHFKGGRIVTPKKICNILKIGELDLFMH